MEVNEVMVKRISVVYFLMTSMVIFSCGCTDAINHQCISRFNASDHQKSKHDTNQNYDNGFYLSSRPSLLNKWRGIELNPPILTYPNSHLLDIYKSNSDTPKNGEWISFTLTTNDDVMKVFKYYYSYYKKYDKVALIEKPNAYKHMGVIYGMHIDLYPKNAHPYIKNGVVYYPKYGLPIGDFSMYVALPEPYYNELHSKIRSKHHIGSVIFINEMGTKIKFVPIR